MSIAIPGFTGVTIDRADALRQSAERLAAMALSVEARMMRLAGLEPELTEDGRLNWGSPSDLPDGAELIFLGLDGDRPLFAPLATIDIAAPRAFDLFAIIETMTPQDAALWGTARALVAWHNANGFCSRCGHPTSMFRAGWGRRCSHCASEHFPRVDPVVIMLAEYGNRVLIGRQPHYPPARYSALAGFVEPGESIEEAVAREIQEEAGIKVGAVRYVASQPWPFPGALMIACLAQAESDALTLDTNELEHAFWVDRPGVAAALAREATAPFEAPPPFAIAHTLFSRWLDEA
jgi:NAD+ diphosphatase